VDLSNIYLDKKNGVPLYLQLSEQLKSMILSGVLATGERLATERTMSDKLQVSRNTISLAYYELESEGLVISRQGSGTYVADLERRLQQIDRRQALMKAIDHVIKESADNGYTLEEFTSLFSGCIRECQGHFKKVHLVFVECNHEQADYFSKEIELGSGVTVEPMLLDEMHSKRENLLKADLVVTSFYHLDEVVAFLPERQDILGIAQDPQVDTIVKIARLSKSEKIGLISSSDIFATDVIRSIQNSGIPGLKFARSTSRNPEVLKQLIDTVEVVVVSPGRKEEVEKLTGSRPIEIIEFIYRPDMGSINLLKNAVLRLRDKED
jgi:GntR family transcriptional regulator